MGTLQAAYTDFPYVDKTSPAKEIFEREALLGCSITGLTANPDILFNPEILQEGARILKEVNKEVAKILGIRQAARLGCIKPSGNASVLLQTPSGIHGEHSLRYLRNVQVNKEEDLANFLRDNNPYMFEESVWSANKTDYIASFPVENSDNYIFKKDLLGVELLKKVKLVQEHWVEASTNIELCVHPSTRHNVSNTINVTDWDEARDYIYNNRKWFAGVSLLGLSGDKDYNQAPFTSVLNPKEILEEYGEASMFASGLIVDGLHAFNDNLWEACDAVIYNVPFEENSSTVLKKDWVRRFKKFATNYYKGDLKRTSYLLKDVHLFHKWIKITTNLKPVDWLNSGVQPKFTEISTTGAMACSGGQCELI
jgi:ribonucleoside-triphosphate reductase (thioredoxin)